MFLQRLLATEEGRRILADSLPHRLTTNPIEPALELRSPDDSYPDLGRARRAEPAKPAPVFITARFRTGSTLLWNLFRHVEGCTAFYEPLNERRWFDPAVRGTRVDRSHAGIEEYWTEYEGLSHLGRHYDERWVDHDLFLDRRAHMPALRAYIAALVDRAPGRAVLQFNRVDFRLPWLRHQFPEARLVHLYRHPRDQWCSSLVDPSRVPTNISVRDFAALDAFYLLRWATDLSYVFPFLRPDEAEHPYDLFYMIWRLSHACGRAHADLSIAFEDLTAKPANEIRRLMTASGVDRYDAAALIRLVSPTMGGRWRRWASQEWFAEREARSDAVLARYSSEPYRPRVVEASRTATLA